MQDNTIKQNTALLGVDLVSAPFAHKENTCPLLINLQNKDGISAGGLKKRDVLLKGATLDPSFDNILAIQSQDDESIWVLAKKADNSMYCIRIAGNGSQTNAAINNVVYNAGDTFRFKAVDIFPAPSSNCFLFIERKDASGNITRYNLQNTLSGSPLTFQAAFTDNTVITSTFATAGSTLNVIDYTIADGRLFCLIEATNGAHLIVYGDKDNPALNSYYLLPSRIRGTGIVSSGTNVHVFSQLETHTLQFNNGFGAAPFFSLYSKNYGCSSPWSYQIVGLSAYIASKSCFWRLVLSAQHIATEEDKVTKIDEATASIANQFNTEFCDYNFTEDSIYWLGSFNNAFVAKAIFKLYEQKKGTFADWQTFYASIKNKSVFCLVFHVSTGAFFLNYYNEELRGLCKYEYSFADQDNKQRLSRFAFAGNSAILHALPRGEEYSGAFPCIFIASTQNPQVITGYTCSQGSVYVSFSSDIKKKSTMYSTALELAQNISYEDHEALNSGVREIDLNENYHKTIKVTDLVQALAPANAINIMSDAIDVFHGFVVNYYTSSRSA